MTSFWLVYHTFHYFKEPRIYCHHMKTSFSIVDLCSIRKLYLWKEAEKLATHLQNFMSQ